MTRIIRPTATVEPKPGTDRLDPGELQALRRDLASAPRIALLLVPQDGVEIRELRAGQLLVVGREAPSDLALADSSLSRRHASFLLSPETGRIEVCDLASTNGTWIGDERVDRATLSVGDEVMLGGVVARVRLLVAPPSDTPAPSRPGSLIAGPTMSAVLRNAERAARSRITILLQGETGTGKEVLARHIHASSPRQNGPMICVNCGAIPKDLVESTFFGHERGAFTGAHQAQQGVFENAHGGTVFLDEIGELPPSAQVALLRVLETGKITRVGGAAERTIDVRVIAATHRDLAAMSEEGQGFRKDLYFRLAAITLEIPSLQERKEDIAQLAMAFLRAANETHERVVEGITEEAQELLLSHTWPGNVRELKNVIERAVVLTETAMVTEKDLPDRIRAQGGRGARALPYSSPNESTAPGPEEPPSSADPGPPKGAQKLRARVQAYEAEIIKNALAKAGGSRNEAARLLGMPLRTLAHRIKALDIDEEE